MKAIYFDSDAVITNGKRVGVVRKSCFSGKTEVHFTHDEPRVVEACMVDGNDWERLVRLPTLADRIAAEIEQIRLGKSIEAATSNVLSIPEIAKLIEEE